MCMKEIQERRISTSRRRLSQYLEEQRKTTQYPPRIEDIRTVNITSSHTKRPSWEHLYEVRGDCKPQPMILSSNQA